MVEEKKGDNKITKAIIIALGTIAIGGGLGPYLLDSMSADVNDVSPTIVETQEHNLKVEEKDLAAITKIKSEAVQTSQTIAKVIENDTTLDTKKNEKKSTSPLPELDASDQFFIEKVTTTQNSKLFIEVDIIRNIVVFVDNFSRGDLLSNFSPLVEPSTAFSVTNKNGKIVIAEESYSRYDDYARTINNIDVDEFITQYQMLMPLIDQVYEEIGYPKGTFTLTFDNALQHILETPIIRYPLTVISSSVNYKFSDENIESLPDTQKLLLRMGPNNLQMVQHKMQQIKNELQRL
ncbi:hypothetical protein CW745_11960 [Psychromonas sp. psych-6C06]|uniref:DUF3014 domain-containing protein n=1 Tax=Psychromonas sp. psych-6C06 TaxID=2058089 RepID=UPI000C33FC79|nr:DUF3014 domain-containing protein [Psychromonas sp. psych-6C06]PKF61020.1 hypothetical protein CW745_11960 [Psychromonas sp. psych-6C06]